jgi:hypothetical protein
VKDYFITGQLIWMALKYFVPMGVVTPLNRNPAAGTA